MQKWRIFVEIVGLRPGVPLMGGEGSGGGGARVGAGRKPKSRRQRQLDGNAGKRSPLTLVAAQSRPPADVGPAETPNTLTPEAQVYWDRWAPKAIELGMLTAGREPGFELMCQIAAARDVEKAGEAGWRDLTRQLGQHMARFGLTADGKPPVGAATVDDEEQQLGRLLAVK